MPYQYKNGIRISIMPRSNQVKLPMHRYNPACEILRLQHNQFQTIKTVIRLEIPSEKVTKGVKPRPDTAHRSINNRFSNLIIGISLSAPSDTIANLALAQRGAIREHHMLSLPCAELFFRYNYNKYIHCSYNIIQTQT